MSTAAGGSSPQELRISADAHMGEPPDLWERELPAKFKDRALQFDEIPFETNHHLRAGCWDPHERLKDLAMDGISAEVLYPTLAVRAWLIDDHELEEAHLRVYNDWMIDFCSGRSSSVLGTRHGLLVERGTCHRRDAAVYQGRSPGRRHLDCSA